MILEARDAAGTYTSPRAPYLQYLNAIEHDFREAEVLGTHLRAAAGCFPSMSDESILHGDSTSIAQLLDVSTFPDSSGNVCSKATLTADLGRHLIRPAPSKVHKFLQELRQCESDVHTRILVLRREWGTDADRAADTLLFCHILGMELDLRPSEVAILARIDDLKDKVVSLRRPAQMPGFVSFGSTEFDHTNSVAACLGRKDFGGISANLVVVALQERRFAWDGPAYPHYDRLWNPILPSQWLTGQKVRARPYDKANGMFAHALSRSLQSHVNLQPIHYSSDGWLSALIHLEAVNCAGWLDHICAPGPAICEQAALRRPQEMLRQADDLCKTLQSDISQVTAYQRTPGVHVTRSDYDEALLTLERLLLEAKVRAAEIKDSLDLQHRNKSTQVTELAINESRSAIAMTVLAFVFIPINLASSVYGMNVQEINETGHSIWAFLITASVLSLVSGFAWMCWRASRNWGIMIDQTGRALPPTVQSCWQASTLFNRMRLASERFKRQDLAYYIGLRSVEKKNSAV